MVKHFIFLALGLTVVWAKEIDLKKQEPLYKYRYETEDLMKTAASSIPVRGYHVVEGGYYPEDRFGGSIGYDRYIGRPFPLGYEGAGLGLRGAGLGLGGAGLGVGGPGLGLGYGGIGGPGFIGGAGLHTVPYYGGYGGYGGHGGGYIDKSAFNADKKNLNDEVYEKAHGQKGEEYSQGQHGYNKDLAAIRNNKGESGYYNQEGGGKKAFGDEKSYQGAQHYNQEGKNGGELSQKSGHKKGHVIKGFKTSHHKDESGKTEEYYDEENDEGGKVNYNNNFGAFGEKAASSFKGGHEDGKVQSGVQKQEGHYNNEHIIDNANAAKGDYGAKKYGAGGSVYGVNNGIDQHSLLGHQEASKFYKHSPHVPFF